MLYATVTEAGTSAILLLRHRQIIISPNNKMKMKQKKCIAGILLLGAVCAQANNYEVTSPDGRLAVKVECVDGNSV